MKARALPTLPVDRHLPLATILDPAAVADLLAASLDDGDREVSGCRVRHVRYRPGEDCVVLYDVDLRSAGEPSTTRIYARCVAGGAAAAISDLAGPWARGALLAGPLAVPALGAICHEFPNDPRLPAIRSLADRAVLGRDLTGVLTEVAAPDRVFTGLGRHLRPIRYKPESRLVVRCRTRWRDQQTGESTSERCLLRFERGAGNSRAETLLRRLAAQDPGVARFSVPRVLFRAPALGCTGMAWVEGERLSRVLKDPADRSRGLAVTAGALAALHRYPAADLPRRSAEDQLRNLAARQSRLAGYPAKIQLLVGEVLRQLTSGFGAGDAGPQRFVHGDFHQGQLLLAADRPCLLDFDRAHAGETVADLGSFTAQLELLGLRGELAGATAVGEEFVAAYEDVEQQQVDRRRLALWTAQALLELAVKELRRLKPSWHERTVVIGERCLAILDGSRS